MNSYKKLVIGLIGSASVGVIIVSAILLPCRKEGTGTRGYATPSSIDMQGAFGKENTIPIVILGSGPAGLGAAIYGARANIKTVVFEEINQVAC